MKSGSPNVLLANAPNVIVWFPFVLVRLKFAVGKPAPRLARTLYGPPAVPLAVNAGAVATPLAFVVAVAVVTLPGNAPLAPLDGAVKVTVTPVIGLPDSVTVAWSRAPKAVLIGVLCSVP